MSHDDVLATKAMDLASEWMTYLIEHPERLQDLPDKAEVVLLPAYDPELAAYNRANAGQGRGPGRPLVYVKVGSLAPPRSRLRRVRVERVA